MTTSSRYRSAIDRDDLPPRSPCARLNSTRVDLDRDEVIALDVSARCAPTVTRQVPDASLRRTGILDRARAGDPGFGRPSLRGGSDPATERPQQPHDQDQPEDHDHPQDNERANDPSAIIVEGPVGQRRPGGTAQEQQYREGADDHTCSGRHGGNNLSRGAKVRAPFYGAPPEVVIAARTAAQLVAGSATDKRLGSATLFAARI